MFEKAGVQGWKAFVPFYNVWVMIQLGNRAKYTFFLQFIPVLGWFITMSIYVEFIKTFGKFKLHEHAMAALLPVVYFSYVGFNAHDKFIGAEASRKHKKYRHVNGLMLLFLRWWLLHLSVHLFLNLTLSQQPLWKKPCS